MQRGQAIGLEETNLGEEGTKGVLVCTFLPLRFEENSHALRAMGERPTRPSSLRGSFPICGEPKGCELLSLPSKKGAPSCTMHSFQKAILREAQWWRDSALRRWSHQRPRTASPKAPGPGKSCNDGLPLDSRCRAGNTRGQAGKQNLFNFRNFYNQMNFSPVQRLAITKAIIELRNQSRGSNFTE